MTSITLAQAKAFLRVTGEDEDALIALLIEAAQRRIEAAVGLALEETSPAPLRLCVLLLVAHGFEHREAAAPSPALIEPWLAPYRRGRL